MRQTFFISGITPQLGSAPEYGGSGKGLLQTVGSHDLGAVSRHAGRALPRAAGAVLLGLERQSE
jgi:hypothetical protein